MIKACAGAFLLAVAVAAVTAATAAAEQPGVVRVRGTVEGVQDRVLQVKERGGATVTVRVADNAPISAVVKASFDQIKPNAYIAVTAMPQPDGSQQAVAILIFPEALRGVAEGFRPWDYASNSTMTNGTVDSSVAGVDGRTLTLKYKGGEQKVVVPPAAQIVGYARATMADVKPGEKVFIVAARRLPDGSLEAPSLSVGDYGVWR